MNFDRFVGWGPFPTLIAGAPEHTAKPPRTEKHVDPVESSNTNGGTNASFMLTQVAQGSSISDEENEIEMKKKTMEEKMEQQKQATEPVVASRNHTYLFIHFWQPRVLWFR